MAKLEIHDTAAGPLRHPRGLIAVVRFPTATRADGRALAPVTLRDSLMPVQ